MERVVIYKLFIRGLFPRQPLRLLLSQSGPETRVSLCPKPQAMLFSTDASTSACHHTLSRNTPTRTPTPTRISAPTNENHICKPGTGLTTKGGQQASFLQLDSWLNKTLKKSSLCYGALNTDFLRMYLLVINLPPSHMDLLS